MGIYKDTLNYLLQNICINFCDLIYPIISRLKITTGIPLDDSWSIKLNLNNEQQKLSSVTL